MLPLDSPLFPGCFKLVIQFLENVFVSAVQFVCRRDADDRAVKPDAVVTRDVLCHKSPGIIKRKRRLRTNAFSFERLMISLQLAVRRGS